MKTLTAIALSLVAVITGFALFAASPARETVLPAYRGETLVCSVVAIAPGLGVTARHCLMGGPLVVGDAPVGVVAVGESDIAIIVGEGIACPCASVSRSLPEAQAAVIVVGFPMGLGVRVETHGHLQGLRDIMSIGRRIVTTAPAAPGNSGGGVFAVVDGREVLIGIVTEGAAHISLAVPADEVAALLEEYRGANRH